MVERLLLNCSATSRLLRLLSVARLVKPPNWFAVPRFPLAGAASMRSAVVSVGRGVGVTRGTGVGDGVGVGVGVGVGANAAATGKATDRIRGKSIFLIKS